MFYKMNKLDLVFYVNNLIKNNINKLIKYKVFILNIYCRKYNQILNFHKKNSLLILIYKISMINII